MNQNLFEVEEGALDEFLKKRHAPMKEKINKMILGSAWGLEYLHAQNCMHMDIAARNCLYSKDQVVSLRHLRSQTLRFRPFIKLFKCFLYIQCFVY